MESDDVLHRIILKGRVSKEDWPIGLDEVWAQHLAYYDHLAARLAMRYQQGAYTFDEAFRATDVLWIDMLARNSRPTLGNADPATPRVLFDLYEAFDAGEWNHQGRYENAVNELTMPMFRRIVDRL
jgi:hypothetical protein